MTDEPNVSGVPSAESIDAAGAAHLTEVPENTLEELTERVRALESKIESLFDGRVHRLEKVLSTLVHPSQWSKHL